MNDFWLGNQTQKPDIRSAFVVFLLQLFLLLLQKTCWAGAVGASEWAIALQIIEKAAARRPRL